MKEQAVKFGEKNNLLGILSKPKNPTSNDLPAIIILNSGLLHKVGPFRLNTELSRKIAENGFNVLRFDLSGIGDSKISFKEGNKWEKAISDVRQAMNYISENCGQKEFVLMGLCSGSDNSYRISLKEKRVVGTVNLDGLSFRTPTYFFKFYGERLFSSRFLMEKLKRMRSQKIALKEKSKQEGLSDPVAVYLDREFPTKEKAIKDFKLLVSRGVKLLYIFTGDVQHYNNYKNQLRDSNKEVDFQDLLDLEYYPYAQHTYTTINSRKKVIKRIVYWLDKHFGL